MKEDLRQATDAVARLNAKGEKEFFAPEAKPGKSVSAHGCCNHSAEHGRQQNGHGVSQKFQIIEGFQCFRIVFKPPGRRYKGWRIGIEFSVGHQGRSEDPVDGKYYDQTQKD